MSPLLRIGAMMAGGSAVGSVVADTDETAGAGGAALAVPFALPRELVRVAALPVRTAAEVEVLERSAERAEPGCRHFGVCGGCQYQHAAYGAQLRMKEETLRGLLRGAGLAELPQIETHAGEPWGYRNRVRMRVERVRGVLRVGYSSRAGAGGDGAGSVAAFVAIGECPIAAPVLWRAAEAFCRAMDGVRAEWAGEVVEVEMFATGDGSRVQMTVFVREGGTGSRKNRPKEGGAGGGGAQRTFAAMCEAVRAEVQELAGAGLMALPAVRAGAGSRRMQRARAVEAWGVPGLNYRAAGREYWVSRGGFFQANRFLVDDLLRLVTGGRRGGLAWDLYAGVGLFSRALAEDFAEVVAVEGGEVAVADLAAAARKMPGIRVEGVATLDFLRRAAVERERPELVVMDPPRAGVGLEIAGLLCRIVPAEMVYVSCDPQSLARDLRAMVDSGYNLAELHLVDLFPQTFHMETVAVLRR